MYLKDCSYEAPNGPRVDGNWNPQINLDLHTGVTALSPEQREVVLTVTVSAKQGETTLFLVEVKQAGVFLMRNLSEDEVKRAIASICPSVLFPYARAAVSQLVTQGGFPQFLLPPVNFDALYTRAAEAPAGDDELGIAVSSDTERGAPIAVLGAGSWGTALAIQFARSGRPTRLWGRNAEAAARRWPRSAATRATSPGGTFPDSLSVASDLAAALHSALDVLVAVPSHAFRAVLHGDRAAPRAGHAPRLGHEGIRSSTAASCRTRSRATCSARRARSPCCRVRPSRRRWARGCRRR